MICSSELQSILPQQLQPETVTKLQQENPNVGVLFCNLEEIFNFHSKLLLPELSNCVDAIELVGLCFIQKVYFTALKILVLYLYKLIFSIRIFYRYIVNIVNYFLHQKF